MTEPDAPTTLAENVAQRSATNIGLTWVKASEEGGTPVIDYQLWYRSQYTLTFTEVDANILTESYLMTALTTGVTYTFKVTARNSHGLSPYSTEVSVLCATSPSTPLSVQTTLSGANVIVSWTAQPANGTPLTSYKVHFRQSDNSYESETVYCDGETDSSILTHAECTVPMTQLTIAPFLLVQGDSIDVKVIAVNQYGQSAYSQVGSGAVI